MGGKTEGHRCLVHAGRLWGMEDCAYHCTCFLGDPTRDAPSQALWAAVMALALTRTSRTHHHHHHHHRRSSRGRAGLGGQQLSAPCGSTPCTPSMAGWVYVWSMYCCICTVGRSTSSCIIQAREAPCILFTSDGWLSVCGMPWQGRQAVCAAGLGPALRPGPQDSGPCPPPTPNLNCAGQGTSPSASLPPVLRPKP